MMDVKDKRSLTDDEFNKLSPEQRDLYLKGNYENLENFMVEWGSKISRTQDENRVELVTIKDNHTETVECLKNITETLNEFTQAVFGDKKLEYIGVVKRQKDLEDRVEAIEKAVYTKLYTIKKEHEEKIEEIEKNLEKKNK